MPTNLWNLSHPTPKARTLVFLLRHVNYVPQILLGRKKVRFGAGKFGGIGGKIDPGETILQAAVRELYEESNVHLPPQNLTHMAHLDFKFPYRPAWSQTAYVFIAHQWEGSPQESEEIEPHWLPYSQIPYENMWADAAVWLPYLLKEEQITAEFTYGRDNESLIDHTVTRAENND